MRRIQRLIFAIFVAVLCLEAVLQLGALAVAWSYSPPSSDVSGRASVLCIGDSFTFGIGASAPRTSYPGQLQAALARSGVDVDVINGGFPGQHSGDLLAKLDQQLTPNTRAVCVLVGTNDGWRHPERMDRGAPAAGATTPGRFRLTWRTGKLLDLLRRFEWFTWERTAAAAEQPSFAKAIDVSAPASSSSRAALLDLGFGLMQAEGLAVGSTLPANPSDPAAPDWPQRKEVWDLLAKNKLPEALASARKLAESHPQSPQVLQLVVAAATRSGLREEALQAVDRIAQLAAAPAATAARDALCATLLGVGRAEEAVAAAAVRIAEEPRSAAAWRALQQAQFDLGRKDEARESMPRALDLMGKGSPAQSGPILRNYVRLIGAQEPKRAARLFLAAYLLDEDLHGSRLSLQFLKPHCPADSISAELAGLGLSESDAGRALAGLLQGKEDGEDWKGTLQHHLAAIHDAARAKGAAVVLLTYPFHQLDVDQVQRRAAAMLDAPIVPIRERFEAELKTRARTDLFVADGHCNDAGYGLMAEEVAAVLLPLLEQPR